MLTLVPLNGVGLFCICTQYVSPVDGEILMHDAFDPDPGVRAIALSQSFPTPNTQELFCVVTRVAVGAPFEAFAL